MAAGGGRNGHLDYQKLDDPVDEGPWHDGPLLVAWGAEEMYKPTKKSGTIGQKGHSVCPWFLKKRWYDLEATQATVDVRGVWPSDLKTRAASPPGCPLAVYGAWKAARDQPEFVQAFLMLCAMLDALLPLEGRSNRSASLGVALSAVYSLPIWLPTFGDLHTEWWAVARLPDEDVDDLKRLIAESRLSRRGPFGGGGRSSGSADGDGTGDGPPGKVHVEADYGLGRFDPKDIEHLMPSLGNPVVDAVRWEVWRVAPSVLLELDSMNLDNACMRSVANLAGHSDDGARFVRELFSIFQRNDADVRTYRNPSAAITSAVRKEMDRLRPDIERGRSVLLSFA
ncbi:unnamed protein product [Symbiodinium sp. CCMP2592]|nr:unnamed protein product [Symbiodinium sp. CCMP2592]